MMRDIFPLWKKILKAACDIAFKEKEKTMKKKVIIIPCSGIGKPLGSASRQAMYEVVEKLRPNTTNTVCLALLVSGDEKAVRMVQENPCIALDGCAKNCALKNIELAGGKVHSRLRVMDIFRNHNDLKPEAVLHLGKSGEKLVKIIAKEVAWESDRLLSVEAKSNE